MAIDLYDCILETFHPLRIYDDKVPTKSHWEFYMKLIANAVALIAVTSFALLSHVVYAAEPAGERKVLAHLLVLVVLQAAALVQA